MPDVSVVLGMHNARRYIGEAVESILNQQGITFELIVVDDASSDGSYDVVDALAKVDDRVRLIRLEQNCGLAVALNAGVAEAQAPFLARLDADDIAMPERLIRQRDFLVAHPDIAFLGSAMFSIGAESQLVGWPPAVPMTDSDQIAWRLHFVNPIVHPTIMTRTDTLRVNPYNDDPLYRYCEDYELWCRLNATHKFTNLTLPLIKYRHHQGQVTHGHIVWQNKGALACSRRCTEKLIGASIAEADFEKLHDIGDANRTLTVDDFRMLGGMLTRMLVAFLTRKINRGEKIDVAGAILVDCVLRLKKYALATGQPLLKAQALLKEQQTLIGSALQNMAALRA